MLHSLRNFDDSEIAEQRMKIIKFYEEYGEKAAKEVFGADRKVISKWRKKLKQGGGKLDALIPESTRPRKKRTPNTTEWIIGFIKGWRVKYPRLGKEKIKPLLDSYCKEKGLQSVSESTIGNIIKRHKLFFPKTGKVYHNPLSPWAQNRVKKKKRLRVKHSPKPEESGYIVADTVTRITDGVKDYFYSAIDGKMKFAVTVNYKRLSEGI